MSTGLPTIQQIAFDNMVKAAYQARAKLRKHVRLKTGVVGGTARFYRSGRGVATQRIAQTDVTPMNTSYVPIDVTVSDWNAPEYTDVFDQSKTAVQERAVVAENIAAAIGRREDQMILDALDAANGSATIAAGGTGVTDAKLRAAKRFMDARSVPMGKRKLAISARGAEDLLGETRFSSKDYVDRAVVSTGMLPPIYGFDIEIIEDRAEGGLPLVSTTRTFYAWDADSIGLAVGLDGAVKVDWIAEKTSWLANQYFSGGAVAIDPEGVIELQSVEA